MNKEIKQGGFSKELWKSSECQKYVTENPCCFGYFGSSGRTKFRDQFIETALLKTGLGSEGTACWLTSTSARHMADGFYRGMPEIEFQNIVTKAVKNAFLEVTIWSHPDHTGMWTSTQELREKIRTAVLAGEHQ